MDPLYGIHIDVILINSKTYIFICFRSLGVMFTYIGLVKEGMIESVGIVKVEISPSEDKYYITLKQDEQHYSIEELEEKFKSMKVDDWEYLEELF